MEKTFRIATAADVNGLVSLWMGLITYHDQYEAKMDLVESPQRSVYLNLEQRLQQENSVCWVCEVDSNLVGMLFCSYQLGHSGFVYHKKGYIAETFVEAAYRKQNIGDMLFSKAETWMMEKGADHIELQVGVENFLSHKFWKSKGFFPTTYHMMKKLK